MRLPLLAVPRTGPLFAFALFWLWSLPALSATVPAPLPERINTEAGALVLNGIGLTRQLNEDFYLAVLYAPKASNNPAFLLDPTRAKRLSVRILADRIYASGVNRHFRDLILINNARDDVQKNASQIQRFGALFKSGLSKGDELIIDFRPGEGTSVQLNGALLGELNISFFELLLRSWIGERAPSVQFRAGLLGELSSGERAQLLSRYAAVVPTEERLLAASVEKIPASEIVSVAPPAAASKPAEIKAAETKIIDKSSDSKAIAPKVPEPKPQEPKAPVTTPAQSVAGKPGPAASTPITPVPSSGTGTEKNVAKTSASSASARVDNAIPAQTAEPLLSTEQAPDAALSATLSEAQINELLVQYKASVRNKLLQVMQYPKRELKRKFGATQLARPRGTATLRLHLDKSGEVNIAWLQKRTNEVLLDNAALATVDAAAPFAPMPAQLPLDAYEFFIDLTFEPD